MGRSAESVCGFEARRIRNGGGPDGLVPRTPGPFQMSAARRVRFVAPNSDGQDPQERTAQADERSAGASMSLENLSFHSEGAVGIITLNRPQRRNALSLELML